MLLINAPQICKNEIRYIVNVIFGNFLGINYSLTFSETNSIEIRSHKDNTSVIRVNVSGLGLFHAYWGMENSMPSLNIPDLDLSNYKITDNFIFKKLPVLYGTPTLDLQDKTIFINFDIFAACFFYLSRYEEIIQPKKDLHSRVMGKFSFAHKKHSLNLPVVDQYVEFLWQILKITWPELERKNNQFKKVITCDLDFPFNPYLYSFPKLTKKIVSGLIRKSHFDEELVSNFIKKKLQRPYKDDFRERISWIMDVNEKCGNKVIFFIIPFKTHNLDNTAQNKLAEMDLLIKEIISREHEVGVHPGYMTYNSSNLYNKSVLELKKIIYRSFPDYKINSSRQHFLMWDSLKTPAMIDSSSISNDFSLGFADMAGFRCGTSKAFKMYDLKNRQQLELIQNPLIAMECSVIAERYQNLGYTDESINAFAKLKEECLKYKGHFSLLWHNNHFENDMDREFYLELIK